MNNKVIRRYLVLLDRMIQVTPIVIWELDDTQNITVVLGHFRMKIRDVTGLQDELFTTPRRLDNSRVINRK